MPESVPGGTEGAMGRGKKKKGTAPALMELMDKIRRRHSIVQEAIQSEQKKEGCRKPCECGSHRGLPPGLATRVGGWRLRSVTKKGKSSVPAADTAYREGLWRDPKRSV